MRNRWRLLWTLHSKCVCKTFFFFLILLLPCFVFYISMIFSNELELIRTWTWVGYIAKKKQKRMNVVNVTHRHTSSLACSCVNEHEEWTCVLEVRSWQVTLQKLTRKDTRTENALVRVWDLLCTWYYTNVHHVFTICLIIGVVQSNCFPGKLFYKCKIPRHSFWHLYDPLIKTAVKDNGLKNKNKRNIHC